MEIEKIVEGKLALEKIENRNKLKMIIHYHFKQWIIPSFQNTLWLLF